MHAFHNFTSRIGVITLIICYEHNFENKNKVSPKFSYFPSVNGIIEDLANCNIKVFLANSFALSFLAELCEQQSNHTLKCSVWLKLCFDKLKCTMSHPIFVGWINPLLVLMFGWLLCMQRMLYQCWAKHNMSFRNFWIPM